MLEHPANPHTLADMLRWCRPHDDPAEKYFIEKYIEPLDCAKDPFGNYTIKIGESDILWSCHTDTVHKSGGLQAIYVSNGIAKSKTECLGADCTTGVFIMTQMIKNKVPGLYVFHRAEESGGKGSSWIQKNRPAIVSEYKFAIAFDRKNFTSIITHQRGSRCCSDEFSASLALALDMKYEKDTTGSFTDTCNYAGLIGECTNISVGYKDQHGPNETQDIEFACRLADRMCVADFSKLVSKRKPGEVETFQRTHYPQTTYHDSYQRHSTPRPEVGKSQRRNSPEDCLDIKELLEHFPTSAGEILAEMGFTRADFVKLITARLRPNKISPSSKQIMTSAYKAISAEDDVLSPPA